MPLRENMLKLYMFMLNSCLSVYINKAFPSILIGNVVNI